MITPEFWQNQNNKIDELHHKYSSYRGVDRHAITSWIKQFDSDEHATLGIKLLENLDYYDQVRIINSFRTLYTLINEYCPANSKIYYCGFGYAGQSGAAVLREFRQANHLDGNVHQDKFIYMNDVIKLASDDEIYLVMLDDIIGTGTQAREILKPYQEIVPDNVRLILSPITIPIETAEALEREFSIKIISTKTLTEDDKLFSESNALFDATEKEVLKEYCVKAGSMPGGYGDKEMIVVFHTKIPNNTVSILRCFNDNWKGIFQRSLPI